MKNLTVKVGTRGSALALAQSRLLLKSLEAVHPKVNFEIVAIKTEGDRITTVEELRKGGKGLFVKEIERALIKKQVSLAIHSMKDLPSEMPKGLILGAVPDRVDPRDVFIGRDGTPIDQLPPGSQVATSSLRRQAMLHALHPGLEFVEMKGNLDTRLKKLRAPGSKLAGLILAAAGVKRLYPDGSIPVQPIDPDQLVPAAGQGVLALQIRADDRPMKKLLAPLHHASTAACIDAERELQRRLEGGCQVPLGCYATVADGVLTLRACIGTVDGRRIIRAVESGKPQDARKIARAVEKALVAQGARDILAALRRI